MFNLATDLQILFATIIALILNYEDLLLISKRRFIKASMIAALVFIFITAVLFLMNLSL
jgi:hypothetical protein